MIRRYTVTVEMKWNKPKSAIDIYEQHGDRHVACVGFWRPLDGLTAASVKHSPVGSDVTNACLAMWIEQHRKGGADE